MPFAIRNLAGLAYAGHVTLWRYRSAADTRATLLAGGYFGPAGHLLRRGDMVLATTADGPLLLEVQSASPGSATLVNARNTQALPASFSALLVGQSGLAATLTPGTTPPVSGGAAPAAPTLAGLALAWDFDFGAAPEGPLGTVASRAGTATTAAASIGGGAPAIITMGNGRRAVDLDGIDDWVALADALGVLNAADDAPFTLAAVAWRDVAGVTQGLIGAHKDPEGSTLNRYEILLTSTNTQPFRKGNTATNTDTTPAGAPSLVAPNIYIGAFNGNPSALRARAMHNGGSKVSAAEDRSTPIAPTPFAAWTMGARCVNADGVTRSAFLNGKIERVFLYAGSATDADMDAIQATLAAYYVA
jgi:hypothetical protein